MSYPSSTYEVTKSNSSNDRLVSEATPIRRKYNEELMFFVCQQVLDAAEEKNDRDTNDLNSIDLLTEVKNRAKTALTADLSLERRGYL